MSSMRPPQVDEPSEVELHLFFFFWGFVNIQNVGSEIPGTTKFGLLEAGFV